MNALGRAVLIAVVQVALIGAVAGKLLYDRRTLPRAWAQTAGVDPDLPIRGRYVALNLVFESAPESVPIAPDTEFAAGSIVVRDGKPLVVLQGPDAQSAPATRQFVRREMPEGPRWMLTRPVAYFLPEDAPDPTRTAGPGQLWVEATFPPHGEPRPIRLR
jgi:hypothetical protein